MNSEEIKERLALIGALAEDAQAGFETMLVPFLLYGIAIPAGTAATYFLACARRTLPAFFVAVFSAGSAGKNTKSIRPYFCRFMGQHRFYNYAELCILCGRKNRIRCNIF